jgi:hypothetical protein
MRTAKEPFVEAIPGRKLMTSETLIDDTVAGERVEGHICLEHFALCAAASSSAATLARLTADAPCADHLMAGLQVELSNRDEVLLSSLKE